MYQPPAAAALPSVTIVLRRTRSTSATPVAMVSAHMTPEFAPTAATAAGTVNAMNHNAERALGQAYGVPSLIDLLPVIPVALKRM